MLFSRFGGTTKVYPSLIASDELHAPRYFMDYDLRGKTELPTKSNKYGIMFKATHDTEDLSWVARWCKCFVRSLLLRRFLKVYVVGSLQLL